MAVETLYKKESGEVVYPNIVSENIPSGAISSPKIGNGAVVASKIANGAIQSQHLSNGAIQTSAIESNAVTSGKIATGAVTEAKIAEGAINEDKLLNSAVTRNKIANKAVSLSKMNVTLTKLVDYIQPPTTTQDILDSFINDIGRDIAFGDLIILQMFEYNGSEISSVTLDINGGDLEVNLHISRDVHDIENINASTPFATAYGYIENIYMSILQ